MFDIDSRAGTALAQLVAARQALCAVDPATLGRDELLELLAAVEVDARRRAAVGYAVVAELEARGIAAEVGCSSTAVLLSERLRIGRREAAGRVRLAAELGHAAPCRANHCRPDTRRSPPRWPTERSPIGTRP
jgi:hypothetical protein